MPIRRELDQDFFKKWSPQMAYVLGFFAADGSMLKNRRGGHYIEFTTTDESILQYIQRACRAQNKIQKRDRNSLKWKSAYRIQIGSKQWFQDLSRLGFTQNKSLTLRFPKVPTRYFGDFVRGYFDGDGCVYFNHLKYADRKSPRYILMTLFTCGCESFLHSLLRGLRTRGVHGGSIKKKNRGFDLVFSHRDSLALHRIMYNTALTSDMFLLRKREKLEKAIRVLHLRA